MSSFILIGILKYSISNSEDSGKNLFALQILTSMLKVLMFAKNSCKTVACIWIQMPHNKNGLNALPATSIAHAPRKRNGRIIQYQLFLLSPCQDEPLTCGCISLSVCSHYTLVYIYIYTYGYESFSSTL